MLRPIVILIVSVSLSACSSQGGTWVAEQVLDVVFDIIAEKNGLNSGYDESQIFPSSNQRLACQLDAKCNTPLTESEFRRSDIDDQLLVLYDDDHQPRRIPEQTFVPLSIDYQNYLRRQRAMYGDENQWRPVVFRDPEDLMGPLSTESGDRWR